MNSNQKLIQSRRNVLLMGLLLMTCWACFLIHQGYLPRGGSNHSELGPSTSENALQTCLKASLTEVLSQLTFPIPLTLLYVKLTET